MFRIEFDHTNGCFVIQVLRFGFLWKNVQGTDSFLTYEEAVQHVRCIGLDKLYEDKSANKFREHMQQTDYRYHLTTPRVV